MLCLKRSFRLINLNKIPDQELLAKKDKHPLGIALLLTLKHVFDDNLEITFETVLRDVYKNLDRDQYRNELKDMLNYLFNEGNFSNKKTFYSMIQNEFSSKIGDNIMTLAQQERAEGKVEGKHEEKLEIAKKMLDANLDIIFISKITGLNKDAIVKISMKQS